ncbi:MAG: glutamate-1-semialdehyde 2,1-aminomutase [Candidatus Hydrogenedentota bacterium]
MRVLPYHLPLVVERARGASIWDADGHELIDMNMGYGPLLFGHCPEFINRAIIQELNQRGTQLGFPHELAFRTAELVKQSFPSVDLLRFTSTGTEAGQTAVRLARAYTGRPLIVLFEGHYHGSSEGVFHRYHATPADLQTRAGYESIPGTRGMSRSIECALVIPWNDTPVLESVLQAHGHEVAAIVMEPVMGNAGVIAPVPGFLEDVRGLADRYGALLIFDEVITGFRVARGGAQELYGVHPDLTMFSKAIGGGVPLGAIGGRHDVMKQLADGTVFHGGVYSGNPLSLAAALAVQEHYDARGTVLYDELWSAASRLAFGLERLFRDAGVCAAISHVGPMLSCWLLDDASAGVPHDYRSAASRTLHERYIRLQHASQLAGVYFHPNRFEPWYLSTAHTPDVVDTVLERLGHVIGKGDWI